MRESVPSGVLTSVLRPAFVAASVVWALLLPLAPLIAARPHAAPLAGLFLSAVYIIGSAICHQLPERSFHLLSHQLPVCARCTGIYTGAAFAAIVAAPLRAFAVGTPARPRRRSDEDRRSGGGKGGPTTIAPPTGRFTTAGAGRFSAAASSRAMLGVAALPAAISLLYEWTTGHMPSHWARAATGLPLGAAVAWLLVQAMTPQARAADQVN
jgi:hypothetical protein